MFKSLNAVLLLFASTVVVCCGLYPLTLFGIGRVLFPSAAAGSLVNERGEDAKAGTFGSRLIAQPFTAEEYFWPRPSAVSYNATASGGSNWGSNNPKLRDRVCRQLGPMVVYKKGSPSAGSGTVPRTPQQDIEAWLAAVPDRAATRAAESSIAPDPAPCAKYFDMWLSDPSNKDKAADLEPVVADMVTASGSGLDPHITLRNALSVYQLDRVAARRTPRGGDASKTRADVESLVRSHSFTPLAGLVGEPLVNVLELNIDLDDRFPATHAPTRTP